MHSLAKRRPSKTNTSASIIDILSGLDRLELTGKADQHRKTLSFMLDSTFLSDADDEMSATFTTGEILEAARDLEHHLTANRDRVILSFLNDVMAPFASVMH